MARKKKTEETPDKLYDPCPIVDTLDFRQKGIFRINGMEFLMKHFPELSKKCKGCKYYNEIHPKAYSCRRFYFTQEITD
jgi:putative ribosome biogenesis GTPase RsgA